MAQDFDSSSGTRRGFSPIIFREGGTSLFSRVFLDATGFLPFFDQFPELPGVGECVLFITDREVGTEEKVLKRVPVENPVNDHGLVVIGYFEIEANIAGAVAVKGLSVPFDLPERGVVVFLLKPLQVFRSHFEFIENLQLLQRGELGNLGSTDFVEYYLEHKGTIDRGGRRDKQIQ